MNCYRCGSPLGSGAFCLRCGADVKLYRRVVRLSNRYYNHGLEKARVRDLTGAVEDLNRALEIHKKNILARNLLGLVLYEMGETVQALCHWVISTHFQEEDNPAAAYVQSLQDNRLELDTAAQGIRKFNFALDYAKKGSEDLAILQLEWVTSHHPKMIKAHCLLALLYHSEGKYSKAERELRRILRADVGNTFALHMLREMSDDIRAPQVKRRDPLGEAAGKLGTQLGEKSEKIRRSLEGRPAFWLKILLTAAIVLSVLAGIMIPTLERRRSKAVSDAVARYSAELEGARSERDGALQLQEAYGVFLQMQALDPKKEEDLAQLHQLFDSLGAESLRDELYKKLYESWRDYLPILDKEAAARAATTTRPVPSTELPPDV